MLKTRVPKLSTSPLDQGCPLTIMGQQPGDQANNPTPTLPKPYPHCQIMPPNFGALGKGYFGSLVLALWTSSDQNTQTK